MGDSEANCGALACNGGTSGTVRARPGRLSALSVFLCKFVLYGVFVWACRVLNSQKRWFLARARGQFVCNNNEGGQWWFPLGTAAAWADDTFPGPCDLPAVCATVKVVELWLCTSPSGKCTSPSDCSCLDPWGWTFVGLLLAGGAVYIGGGIGIARKTRGARLELPAHPHYVHCPRHLGAVKRP